MSDLQVRGADQLATSLHAAAADLAAGMPDVNAEISRLVAAAVQAPVLTGRLARTITPTSDAHTATVTAGGAGVRYAGVIEYGSTRRRIRARLYLRRALERTESQSLALIAAGVQTRLDTVKGA